MSKKAKLSSLFPDWIIITFATIVGAVIRFGFITKSSIWHDEGFSIFLASRTPAEIWIGSARDVHPPLYYLFLHYWISIFGNSVLAIRSLSAIAGIAVIPLGYLVVKRISGKRAALLTGFVLAFAPFLVRYSQEARMYGLLGLLMLAALYAVMRIVQQPKTLWPYFLYTTMIALGMYTHYFTVLAIVAFWFYLITLQGPKHWKLGKSIFLSGKWWLSNIAALVLFLPWVPSAFAQIRRGQGLGWLPKASIHTFHDAVWQFFTFTDARQIIIVLYWLVPVALIASAIYLLVTDHSKEKFSRLLVSYSFLPIVLALLISLQKPIFHERYFAFAAIGIYMIIAITVTKISGKRIWLFIVLSILVLSTEIIGVRNVYVQSNHQMSSVMSMVNSNYQSGDKIIAGEMYVYFDGRFYNHTSQKMLLYTANSNLNGYGESGLLYDQNIYMNSFTQFKKGSRVWLVGKTGEHDYYNQVPVSWQLLQQYSAGYSETRLYQAN